MLKQLHPLKPADKMTPLDWQILAAEGRVWKAELELKHLLAEYAWLTLPDFAAEGI